MTKLSRAFKLHPMTIPSTRLPPSGTTASPGSHVLLGLDVGGTKIEICALHTSPPPARPAMVYRERLPTPQGDYEATLEVIHTLVTQCTQALQIPWPRVVGVGLPGSLDARSQRVRGSNSLVLNGKTMAQDLSGRLACQVQVQNDANCFALSEAMDGAGQGRAMVFGVIIGTGCGGGIVHEQRIWSGANRLGGEWGHTPLPWADQEERDRPPCWCGKASCMERFVSGTGFEEDHFKVSGESLKAPQIVEAARMGHSSAQLSLARYIDRLARGLSGVVNIVDPDCIVLGGGMSLVDEIYAPLQEKLASYSFYPGSHTPILKAAHGDSSGVRGAAWLSQENAASWVNSI